ncbi:hypothetical protein MMC24_001654 [Lignoscripta atroalba]|nr:hypothetical protein [Lignoscripta atroalba]
MAPEVQLSSLANPLATLEQLSSSSSQLDGIPVDLENSMRYAGAQLTQAAGILLRLPQEIIAQAIVTFTRFYIGPEGGSFRLHASKVPADFVRVSFSMYADTLAHQDVSAACLYLTAKVSFLPQSPRSILNVYACLLSMSSPLHRPSSPGSGSGKPNPESYYLSEGTYQTARSTLLATESVILRTVSFTTHVSNPHHLALTYLQTLGALPPVSTSKSSALAKRTLSHLNAALLSPQLLYVTHPPPSLAVAAIYLAARETGTKLVDREWWEVFDVEREELGFLVVAFGSMQEWTGKERERWVERRCPLTLEEVEIELHPRNEDTV